MAYNSTETAPFNAALNTLERITNLINLLGMYKLKAVEGDMTQGTAMHARWEALKQLFIQACPLLKDENEAKIKTMLDSVKKLPIKALQNSGGAVIKHQQQYDADIDKQIDMIEMTIENFLQAEGFFMPPKRDIGTSWQR